MKDTPATDHPSRPVLLQSKGGIATISLPALPMAMKEISAKRRTREANCYPCMVSSLPLPFYSIPPSGSHLSAAPSLCIPFPSYSQCLTLCLSKTFISETALLIKELIFSLLSAISIVNLKHCEFFKFPLFFYQKQRGRKMGMGGYLIG